MEKVVNKFAFPWLFTTLITIFQLSTYSLSIWDLLLSWNLPNTGLVLPGDWDLLYWRGGKGKISLLSKRQGEDGRPGGNVLHRWNPPPRKKKIFSLLHANKILCLKLCCDCRFQRVITACSWVFKFFYQLKTPQFEFSNFEITHLCVKLMRKTTVATSL